MPGQGEKQLPGQDLKARPCSVYNAREEMFQSWCSTVYMAGGKWGQHCVPLEWNVHKLPCSQVLELSLSKTLPWPRAWYTRSTPSCDPRSSQIVRWQSLLYCRCDGDAANGFVSSNPRFATAYKMSTEWTASSHRSCLLVLIWDKRVEVMLSDLVPGGARKKYNRVSWTRIRIMSQ